MTLPEALVWALEKCGVEVDIRPLTTNDNCQFVFAKALEDARREG